MAYLSVINNPSDTVRLRRIVNEPKRSIGEATLNTAEEIAAKSRSSMFQVFRDAGKYSALSRKAGALMSFAGIIDGLREAAKEEPLDLLLDDILEKTGYGAMLNAQGEEGKTRMENIGELKSTMVKYEQATPEGSLSGCLVESALYTDVDSMSDADDCVVLMTMHSSKGLEFPVVFLPGMEDGIFPSSRVLYEPMELEEERRLAYVAIKRAKKKLYLTYAPTRMIFGMTNRNRLSRFAEEIPADKLERSSEAGYESRGFGSYGSRPERGTVAPPPTRTTPTVGQAPASRASSVSVSFKAGDRVKHRVFGEGTVLSVTPMGNDNLVETIFDRVGTKKIMANFAKLQKIEKA